MGVLLLGALTAGVYSYLTYSKSNVLLWQNGVIAASWMLAAACVWQFLNQSVPESISGTFYHDLKDSKRLLELPRKDIS